MYSKKAHLTGVIQVGFRKLLNVLNESIEGALLAESEEKYPELVHLDQIASKLAKEPSKDYEKNPFLSSPDFVSAKSRRTSSLFPSPSKRFEVNQGITIPTSAGESNSKRKRT